MLQIIGSGFGRTGTVSLKVALEMLGFGPCYHMSEVFQNPAHVSLWQAAADGTLGDWSAIFADYRAAIDWPAAAFWKELLAVYPDARVIHTERPEDPWYRSFANTIQPALAAEKPHTPPGWFDMVTAAVSRRSLGGRPHDEATVRAAYARNNTEVRAAVPAERLLVLDPSAGWEPLCAFLAVDVPDVPYPLLNTTEEFKTRFGGG